MTAAAPSDPSAALGLDAGGTHTRWAVARPAGPGTTGQAPALSGLQLGSEEGLAAARQTLQVVAQAAGPVQAVVAGLTGFDAAMQPVFLALAAEVFGLPAARVHAISDIELACRAAPAALVVYAGTGSVAGFIDAQGVLQRAGGRGAVIDDAGGGHWIAIQALRQVWRAEDERPGAGIDSALGRHLFARLGGSDWPATRRAVVGASRGEIGRLALAVAAAAQEGDAAALELLHRAGIELARPARALLRRCGVASLAFAGRVFDLGPAVEAGLREALPAGVRVRHETRDAAVLSAQRVALSARRAMERAA